MIQKKELYEEELRDELKKEIIGQDQAIEAVVQAVLVADLGVCDPNRPLGSFLFLGPTGVGKSQLCRSLAKVLYGDEKEAVTINCTEFKNPHDVAKLTGAPPGYIGHDQAPFLIQEKINKRLTVVAFEEVEKADRALHDLLLQVLERGELKTGRGLDLNFRNCFIFMTSNAGSKEHDNRHRRYIGFTHPITPEDAKKMQELRQEVFSKAIRSQFSPEFLNRIDEQIIFNSLKEEHLMQILNKLLLDVQARLAMAGLGTSISEDAKRFLVKKGTNLLYGARPLRKALREYLEFPVVSEYYKWKKSSRGGPVEIQIGLGKNGEKLRFVFRNRLISGVTTA